MQVESARDYAISGFAKALLDIGDSLSNARDQLQQHLNKQHHEETANQLQQFLDGISLTENLFLRTLQRFGVEQYNPVRWRGIMISRLGV